jgi:hypothetical protein
MDTLFAAVNALSVSILVIVTIWYAVSTHRMLKAMGRQSDLLSASVELQAVLAELQVLQSKNLGPEALKEVLALRNVARAIRSSKTPTP